MSTCTFVINMKELLNFQKDTVISSDDNESYFGLIKKRTECYQERFCFTLLMGINVQSINFRLIFIMDTM